MSAASPPTERVGIVLVHGIGEQRRFQHLDSQTRFLIDALAELKQSGTVQRYTVDIAGTGAAAFAAERDSWNVGPKASATITVDHTLGGAPGRTAIMIHEVWWADVNEPYSLAKQFRFWLWGLTIWALPKRPNAGKLGTARSVMTPIIPRRSMLWDRTRLFLVGVFFMLLGYSIGSLSFLASRLFNLQPPDVLRTITNFISGVKLYNQETRYGPGLFWAREDFLDTVQNPPRVSVRRRMVRAITDVACNRYDRWYVLAHSLGSVVAFNGLMETAYTWPGYLDERRWDRLRLHGMAGPIAPGVALPDGPFMPPRPTWAQPDDIAYRSRIFGRFAGFLTYGAPLEKFAGLWPALVPISLEPAFRPGVPWFNIYDPVDPVSGRLLAYNSQDPRCCPPAEDIGYAASWWLLLAHLKYLTRRRPGTDLASRVMTWVLTDDPAAVRHPAPSGGWKTGTWFTAGGSVAWWRAVLAWTTWIAAAIVLAVVGAIVAPMLIDAASAALRAVWAEVPKVVVGGPIETALAGLRAVWAEILKLFAGGP